MCKSEEKCLSGDTVVWISDGRYKRIDEMCGETVISLDKHSKFVKNPDSELIDNGEKLVYRVSTTKNKSIKITDNHPLLTPDGWVKTRDLKVGDSIACASDNVFVADFHWEKIISIEEQGIEKIYDLSLKTNHNFVANGIVVHNSLLDRERRDAMKNKNKCKWCGKKVSVSNSNYCDKCFTIFISVC